MQGSRHVTSGFITNIRRAGTGIDLAEVEIDFAKIHKLYPNLCFGGSQSGQPQLGHDMTDRAGSSR